MKFNKILTYAIYTYQFRYLLITALTSIFESLNLRAITKTPLRAPSPPMYKRNKLKGITIKSNIVN